MPLQTIITTLLFLAVMYALFTIGFPFLLALMLALMLEPVVLLLTKHLKLQRLYASLIVCSVFTVLFILFGYFLVYKVATEAIGLTSAMLSFLQEFTQGAGVVGERFHALLDTIPAEYQDSVQQYTLTFFNSLQGLINPLLSMLLNMAKKIPTFFLEFVIMFIAMFLISMRLPQKRHNLLQFFDPQSHSRLETVLKNLKLAIFGFLRAQLIISACIFVFVLIGFLILGVDYPSATAFLITVVDILPILGTGSVLIPMSVYYFITGNAFLGIALLVLYGLVIVLRRVIEPKVLGDAIGLSPLSVLVSMYIGVILTGFIGLFLGPAVVILFQALRKVGVINIQIKL